MNKLLIISIITSLVFNCFAETYYVSNSGSNSNSGLTPQTAFLTIQRASNIIIAGDSVIVLPGTYAGFYHTTSGTAQNPIVFSAQPGVLINAPNATTTDGINLEGASYIVVEGFKVFGVARAGLRAVLNNHVVFRNNIADSCGKWGILTGFSDDILIEGNECSRSIAEHGIYFGNSADRPVIRNNICWGNNAIGIHMNGDINTCCGDGIISNALVENNIIHDNGNAGGSGINCDGVQNSLIQNNLLYNNHASGISLYRIDGGGASINNVVVNNTIIQPTVTRWALNISDGSTGNIAFNNIFYSDHSFRGSISVDAASLPGFKSNYNVLTNRMSNDGGNTNMTLAAWQQATQLDSNSITSIPANLFINPLGNDYQLLQNSPANDLGRSAYHAAIAPAVDIANMGRPQGNFPDAGAYELQIATSVIPFSKEQINWNDLSPDAPIFLFDLSGRLVFSGLKRQLSSNAKPVSAGLYIFKIFSGELKNEGGWVRVD